MSHEHADHAAAAHGIEQSRPVTQRIDAFQQRGNGFLRQRQFTAHDAGGREPEHHLQRSRRIAELDAQLAGTLEQRHRIGARRPLRCDQRGSEHHGEVELDPIALRAFRHGGESFEAFLQVRDGFDIGRALRGLASGLKPVADRFIKQAGFGQVLRQRFRLSFDKTGVFLLQYFRQHGVQLGATALEQAAIRGVAHQRHA